MVQGYQFLIKLQCFCRVFFAEVEVGDGNQQLGFAQNLFECRDTVQGNLFLEDVTELVSALGLI